MCEECAVRVFRVGVGQCHHSVSLEQSGPGRYVPVLIDRYTTGGVGDNADRDCGSDVVYIRCELWQFVMASSCTQHTCNDDR